MAATPPPLSDEPANQLSKCAPTTSSPSPRPRTRPTTLRPTPRVTAAATAMRARTGSLAAIAARSACASTPPMVSAGMGPIASQARRIEPTCGRLPGAAEAKIIAAAPASAQL